jgi:DnaJ-class molecular chaperone
MASSADDFYAVLGVAAGVDAAELRRAWRRLAVRYHPDRAGAAATAAFQRLSAAYEVLSDPLKRAMYDRRRNAMPAAAQAAAATSATPRDSAPPRPVTPGVMLTRLSGPINSLLACGVVHFDEPGFVTLMLHQHEAAQGGMASISMRVDLRCPTCAAQQSKTCARCGGSRVVDELFSAWLAVPPGIADGEVLAPSVELPGMLEPVRFRVQLLQPQRRRRNG